MSQPTFEHIVHELQLQFIGTFHFILHHHRSQIPPFFLGGKLGGRCSNMHLLNKMKTSWASTLSLGVCVCVNKERKAKKSCLCVYETGCLCVLECVCVCMCMCVRVCVRVGERKSERMRERER